MYLAGTKCNVRYAAQRCPSPAADHLCIITDQLSAVGVHGRCYAAMCTIITSLAKNDDLQCSYVVANRTDGHQNAELLSLDVTACNQGALQIPSTIQIDFVHNPLTSRLHQQLNHKRIKIVPTPNTQKYRTLLQRPLDHLALKKQADNHLAFDAEFALKNSPVSGVDVIEPRLESIQGSVNQILSIG
jgi:hypothetical protein